MQKPMHVISEATALPAYYAQANLFICLLIYVCLSVSLSYFPIFYTIFFLSSSLRLSVSVCFKESFSYCQRLALSMSVSWPVNMVTIFHSC